MASLIRFGGKVRSSRADETFLGNKKGFPSFTGTGHKMEVMSLVERGGPCASTVLDTVTRTDVERNHSKECCGTKAALMTDTAPYYKRGE